MIETRNAIISDECHRLQTELRQTSQKNLVKGLLDHLTSLRFDIWSDKAQPLQILAPFKEIIIHPNLTDVITSIAVNSVLTFLNLKLFQNEEEISSVVDCLCQCQYQITSDSECLNLSIQILRAFSLIIQNYSDFLSQDSVDSIFIYCEQDVRQLSQKCVHTTFLTDVFSQLSYLIIDREKYKSIALDALNVLFSITDSSYIDNGWVARGSAISALLLCAQSKNKSFSRQLVKITCVIINQQLQFTDGRENFILALRLFFRVFTDKWLEYPLPFARILNSILDCCLTQQIPVSLRCTSFEILIDFVSQKRFFLNFYANYCKRPFFPQLFDKFMNCITTFANLPAPISEAHTSALNLLSLMISQLNDEKTDMQSLNFGEQELLSSQKWEEESEQLHKLSIFANEFNKHPTAFADSGFDPKTIIEKQNDLLNVNNQNQNENNQQSQTLNHENGENTSNFIENSQTSNGSSRSSSFSFSNNPKELAYNILTAPGVLKSSIGEFFSKNTPLALDTLNEYLDLLDFKNLSFDQSIRLFLTSFTILGEGQVIDRNTEAFAKCYFKSHENEGLFKDEKAAHILAYGWLMLHTSMHNQNVTKKTSLADFFSMMKGQNGDEDFDSQFLTTIYNSIKRSEVEIGDDKCMSLAFWELLIQKQRILGFQTPEIEQPTPAKYVILLFKEIWKQAASIFTIIYEKSTENIDFIADTFIKCASISTKYNLHDVLDNLVVSLCKFTNKDNKNEFAEDRAKNALRILATITIEYGAQIHEGWKSFVEVLLILFKLDVLPEEFRTEPALIGRPETVLLTPSMFSHSMRHHSSASSFLAVFKMLGSNEQNNENEEQTPEVWRTELRTFVKELGLERIIDQSVTFAPPSLNFFMQSLLFYAKDAQSKLPDKASEALFCIHLITQIAVANADRISPLWSVISQQYSSFFTETTVHRATVLILQRVTTNIFTLLNHMWGQPKLRNELIKLTDVSTSVDPKIFTSLLTYHLAGFQEFLSLHEHSFIALHQFKSINKTLASSVGIQEPPSAKILHTFLQGIAEDKEPPALDRFAEYWMPLIQTTVLYCIRDPSPEVFLRYTDLHLLLQFGGGSPTPNMWEFVFDSTLFPALEHIPNELTQQKLSKNACERCLLMIKAVFKVFLQVHKELVDLSSFESIWGRLIQYSINIMKVGDQDLKSSIPQLLANALMVMKSSGIFESGSRQKMWNDSKNIIEPYLPYFKQMCGDM